MRPEQTRTYDRAISVVFLKTVAPFGGLSNMAGGFPLWVNGIRILTSEALYQACRFPHRPEVQTLIIEQKSPMTAKMKSKPYRHDSRPDWDQVRVKIMRWCLRVKLAQNWRAFSELLLETGERPIVEESRKDDFWGAKATDDGTLVGMNVLGRLLMELREAVKVEGRESLMRVQPLAIPDFLLGGMQIEAVGSQAIECDGESGTAPVAHARGETQSPTVKQPSLFDPPAVMEAPPAAYLAVSSKDLHVADLKPYADYKESGLPWLGHVPGHWGSRRMKFLFKERTQKGFPNEPLLAATQSKGVVRKEDYGLRTVTAINGLENLKLVEIGDFVISLRSFQGGIEVSHARGIISPAYTVLRPRDDFEPRYFKSYFKSADFIRSLTLFVTGIREGQNIDYERLSRAFMPLPPPDEQTAIVRFLDWTSGRLERAIRAKRKVIALLNEQKQAIIHRAVTRGLDHSVPLKPSGIPWLGDIPQHWEVRPIKHWAKINVRTLGQYTDPDFELRYIDIGAVRTGYLVRPPEPMRFAKAPSRARRILVAGDTIVSTVRTYLKAVWFVGQDAEKLIASTGFAVFSPNTELEPEYLHYVLQDSSFVNQVTANSIGIAYPAIAESSLARFRVAIPASRNEQREVIAVIKDKTFPLNTAISGLEREIDLLREYRNRLVADVVTGKLDVRDAAARLPEEAPLDTVDDDTDLGDELETANEEAAA